MAASLAVGVLIGVERGWRDRDLAEGGRVAGLRTFALVGLLGGALALLSTELGAWPLLGGIVGLSILLGVSYREAVRASGSLSATTAVAMLLTLVLGALAARGAATLALAAAVVTAVLLNLKPTLHRGLQLIEHRELTAALQLLVLSVVILPNLPDAGYGPYQAINPYRLWWAVVLIAGLSLAGHLAMRLTGSQRGLLWTGLLGGLASSTAATLALARHAKRQPALAEAAAAGALAACGVMFLRMIVLVASIRPALTRPLGAPLGAAGLVLLSLAVWRWRQRAQRTASSEAVEPVATFDLGTALAFGGFLAAIAVLVPAAKQWLGEPGIYALAILSGLADVDTIVISMSQAQAAGGLAMETAVVAVGLATLANMGSKATIACITGGAIFGWPLVRGYVVGMSAGALATLGVVLMWS
ncbi:MAG: DUF4010 domain-containing protein [Burkholderiaceae bacterium]|nr:DUF4010 domain-containing protein [Burkholderiaceae bacterium]